jgi:acyl-CoA reductase-like NAD-dependent aldehyde dehydrogenase
MLVRHSEAISDDDESGFWLSATIDQHADRFQWIFRLFQALLAAPQAVDEARQVASFFPLNLLGGRATVEYQPKGVAGVIASWNFPLGMVFEALAGIWAAGSRAMIKSSEFTPAKPALRGMLWVPLRATWFPSSSS